MILKHVHGNHNRCFLAISELMDLLKGSISRWATGYLLMKGNFLRLPQKSTGAPKTVIRRLHGRKRLAQYSSPSRQPRLKLPHKSALSRHQVEILHKCREDSMLVELMAITGRSDRTKFRHQVLNPLQEAGLVEMTIPDKPRSSKQRYRLTEKGREWLDSYMKRIR